MPVFSEGTDRILRSSSSRPVESLETQLIVVPNDRFSTEQQIFCDAKRSIIRAAAPTELVYLGIPPAWGAVIVDSLADDSETTGAAR